MKDHLRFVLKRVSEMLWVKPLAICFISIAAAFLTQVADRIPIFELAPKVTPESVETLLSIISASMLVIAVFAVGAMLSAYQSASNAATPRTFSLVIADDVSQNALSTFIGAFIFSIVAQIALMNGYYGDAAHFALFVITILVFALVIFSFIRWVDRIARLGRMGTIIEKVEIATEDAWCRRIQQPFLSGKKAEGRTDGFALYSSHIGYIQRIDIAVLQSLATKWDLEVEVAALPGTFATPDKPLAYIRSTTQKTLSAADQENIDQVKFANAFVIGKYRTFDDDPRFGFIVLSEIASRALSPAVNDPGTAIGIVGVLVRLLVLCTPTGKVKSELYDVECDRVAVPEINVSDIFDDAFNPIARDGAAMIEVVIRLQKALASLAVLGDEKMKAAAIDQARLVLAHAEKSLQVNDELNKLHQVSVFAQQ